MPGGAGGSLIKTINGGDSWEILPRFLGDGTHIEEILLNPADANFLYIRADRLYKSEDGGQTITEIGMGTNGFSTMDTNPANASQLLAGTWQGTLHLSENGGNSLRKLPLSIPPNHSISAVTIASETEFWVGTRSWDMEQENFGFLYHSSNGGNTWEEITNADFTPESAVRSIITLPEDPHTVFVGLMDINNMYWENQVDRYLLKSTDNGESWQRISLIEYEYNIGVIDLVDQPAWDDNIYIGSGGSDIYRSKDGGQTFSQISLAGSNGDVIDLAIDPRDTDVIYVPTLSYGILKSTNGGLSWEWKNNGLRFMGLSLLETNRNADTGLILATGAGGEGLFLSRDYGATWTKLNEGGITHPWGDEIQINPHRPQEYWFIADVADVFVSENEGHKWKQTINPRQDSTGFRYGTTHAIAVAPSNPKVIYADKNGFGIYRTVHYEDGDVYWTFLHQSQIDYTYALAAHPADENIAYAGSIPKPFENFAMLRKTYDGGYNWETVLNIPDSAGVTDITFAGNSQDRMFAASTGASPAVYRSDDAGNNWSRLPLPFNLSEIGAESVDYIELIPFPGEENILFLSASPGGVFFTSTAGDEWVDIGWNLPEFQVLDGLRQGRHNLAYRQAEDGIFYVSLYNEGVYKSTDWGETWILTSSETTGLGILSFAIDPANDDLFYLGTREGLFRSEDGGENWSSFETGGHVKFTDVSTLEFGPHGVLYAGTLGYEIFALFPGKQVWKHLRSFDNFGTFWPIWDGRPLYQYSFLEFHPTDPDTILLGTFPAGIYISQDGGISWQESNTNFTWDGVFSLTYHPQDANILYAGTYNGVNRSLDGGHTWEQWDNGWPDEQWTFSIDFDPRNPEIMYAVSKNGENSGRGQPGIFMGVVMKSENGGETWQEIMRGLPRDNEYYKIIVDPYAPDVLYLASQVDGIFISSDAGNTWQVWNEGLTTLASGTNGNNVTNTMALSPDGLQLYFASAGEGVFRRMTISAAERCGCMP
jgi:photosystem II stability/assembly factor-like uncharacterized protein